MQIQGTTHRSPLSGQRVSSVHGIVTARTASGFYLQDAAGDGDPTTSDALFVFTRSAPNVATGDRVELSGTVFEYRPDCSSAVALDDETCSPQSAAFHNLSVTELVSPSIEVHSSGHAPPAVAWIGGSDVTPPTQISDAAGGSAEDPDFPFDRRQHALDFFETLEGMRVAVAAPLVVGPTDAFGGLPVLADLGAGQGALTSRGGIALTAASANGGRIKLDDAFAAIPQADVGDTLSDVEGILDYRFGSYRVLITRGIGASEGSAPKQTAGVATPGWLSVASFNVENLAPTSSRKKRDGLAAQIATHLGGPALIALAEMQDDSGATDDGVTTAAGNFGALVAAIEAAGGPAYRFVQIDPVDGADGGAPGANIRVGFLYDPLRVAFDAENARLGDATTAIGLDAHGRLDLDAGRIDPASAVWSSSRKPLAARFRIGGRTLVAIALHLRSKSGDGPLFGRFQPPIAASRAAREAQADVVGRFVEEALGADPDAAVVVLGDLNDFDFAPALVRLEAAGLRNLTKQLPEAERYTFVFDGNAQALDHMLVSASLAATARYQIVHVNSEYRAADRASDHDPVLALLAMPSPEPHALALGLASGGTLASLGASRMRNRALGVPTSTPL